MTDLGKITVTFFGHYSARSKTEQEVTLAELGEMIEAMTGVSKSSLPWLKLAVFGIMETDKKCLRHDANVHCVTGCEADYDAEVISFDEAKDKLEKAGITALIYTSASHTPDRPRYRIVCPFSQKLAPRQRAQMVARLNGLFGGALAAESFALSQAYYYGHILDADRNVVAHRKNGNGATDVVPGECRVELIEGQPIDQCDELDHGAIGKGGSKSNGATYSGGDYTDIQELVRRITSSDSLHPSVGSIAGKYAKAGHPLETCVDLVGAAFALARQGRYGGRWDECVAYIHDVYRREAAKRGGAGGNDKEPTPEPQPEPEPEPQPEPEPNVIEPVDLWGQFDAPPLPTGLLPDVIEQFAREEGDLMGADPAGLAIAALAVCAAALPESVELQVKRHDPNWREAARIWVGLIGYPSTKKSPIIQRAGKPLRRIDNNMWRAYLTALDAYNALPKKQKQTSPPPKQKRLRIEDATIEAAQEVLKDSPDGVLCFQDELSGWFGAMDKYSGHGAAKDRCFWLQSYNGGIRG